MILYADPIENGGDIKHVNDNNNNNIIIIIIITIIIIKRAIA